MTDAVTPEELRVLLPGQPTKYHSRRTYVPSLGRSFASKHEATVAVGLALRQELGEIRDLRFQVRFPLEVEGELVCTYVADFVYEELWPRAGEWVEVIADAKGYPTPLYKLKKRWMSALGIEIEEL